jgi:hypothetical protein
MQYGGSIRGHLVVANMVAVLATGVSSGSDFAQAWLAYPILVDPGWEGQKVPQLDSRAK